MWDSRVLQLTELIVTSHVLKYEIQVHCHGIATVTFNEAADDFKDSIMPPKARAWVDSMTL